MYLFEEHLLDLYWKYESVIKSWHYNKDFVYFETDKGEVVISRLNSTEDAIKKFKIFYEAYD
jgi:hypothetical protein